MRHDAGQVRLAHRYGGVFVGIEMFGHRHWLKAARIVEFVAHLLQGNRIEPQYMPQFAQRHIDIDDPLGDQIDTEIGLIAGDRLAVAVKDPAPARRDQRQIDPV